MALPACQGSSAQACFGGWTPETAMGTSPKVDISALLSSEFETMRYFVHWEDISCRDLQPVPSYEQLMSTDCNGLDHSLLRQHTGPAALPKIRRESWSSIPTNLILAELQRRQDDGEKPECGSRTKGSYNTSAHVFALILILSLSTLACGFPLISRRTMTGQRQKTIIFYCQHIGTGVLLATAFVHLLPTAFVSLTDPCLPYFFSKGYPPLPGFVAMASAIIVTGVESYLTARGAGHSHSHSHGYWDEHDEAEGVVRRHERASLAERRPGGRPADISLGDMEVSEGLMAGASPLPESTPTARENTKLTDGFDDGDSDLELDMAELDPAPVNGSNSRNGQYASLKPDGTRSMSFSEAQPKSADDHKRQMLQCFLLEAGILFHSVFIGMAISVATGPAFVVFLVAISFHQSFEGLALGSRIAAIQFPRSSIRPWLMVLAYGVTTPIGQAIGLVVHRMYDPQSMGGLLVVGFMNAVSSGLLLYAGLVQLLAEDFLTEKSYKILKGRKRLYAYISVVAGALLMALTGTGYKWLGGYGTLLATMILVLLTPHGSSIVVSEILSACENPSDGRSRRRPHSRNTPDPRTDLASAFRTHPRPHVPITRRLLISSVPPQLQPGTVRTPEAPSSTHEGAHDIHEPWAMAHRTTRLMPSMPTMSRVRIVVFLAIQTLLAAYFLNRSPYTMSSTPPTKAWADGPMKLVTTPQYETKKTDIFTTGATHMALLHNAIIRGFNSIYLQAPHVQDVDKAAFIGYSLTWFRFVKSHHDDEEDNLFPKVQDLLGDDAVWTGTHEEHESFLGGLVEFNTYLTTLASPTALSAVELIRIMDSFKPAFENHFHSEIATIAALAGHRSVPADGTPEATLASNTFKTWGKATVTKAGMLDVVPFFLLNLDRTAEGGLWANWPPMPAPVKWGMVNLAGSWYGSWWKFASCDAQGLPQELYALRT
ncbi:hypothetical protein G7046_g4069 [Stylonectria norvegica]|nr:hypothetical protein G7046_g4069 [Stylonectria norvegica]